MAEYQDDFDEGAQQARMKVYRDKYKKVTQLKKLVEAMHAVKKTKEELEANLKEANAEFDVLRFELIPTQMENDGVERVSYEGIGRVSLTADLRVTVLAQNKAGLMSWFRKNKLGDLVSETINASTLKAWVKKRMTDGKTVPSELLNVTPITRASITKG